MNKTTFVLLLVLLLLSVALARRQHWRIEEFDDDDDEEESDTFAAAEPTEDNACWKTSYGRGVGKPLSQCRNGEEKNGALCYPQCREGYYGVGPVCWQHCPSGFRNDGAYCFKPSSYGRGAGYVLWKESKCKQDHSQGCEKDGALWYPKCRPGFKKVGCCVCSPICPQGMTDIGISCQKHSYGRTTGKPMICANDKQEDAGLCYNYCKSPYYGIGPVYWQTCPPSKPYECGAMCTNDKSVCTEKILKIVKGVLSTVAKAATKDAASELVIPLCGPQ